MPIREQVSTVPRMDAHGNTVQFICSDAPTPTPPAASVLETIPQMNLHHKEGSKPSSTNKKKTSATTTTATTTTATTATAVSKSQKSIASFFSKAKDINTKSSSSASAAGETRTIINLELDSDDERFHAALRYGEEMVIEMNTADPSPALSKSNTKTPSMGNSSFGMTYVSEIKEVHVLQPRSKKVKSPSTDTASVAVASTPTFEGMKSSPTQNTDDNCSIREAAMDTSTTDPVPLAACKRSFEVVDSTTQLEKEPMVEPTITILQPRSKKKKLCDVTTSPFLNQTADAATSHFLNNNQDIGNGSNNNTATILVVSADAAVTGTTTFASTTSTTSIDKQVICVDMSDSTHKETKMDLEMNETETNPIVSSAMTLVETAATTGSIVSASDLQVLRNEITSLRTKYCARVEELVQRVIQGLIEEEDVPSDVRGTFVEEEYSVLETTSKMTSTASDNVEFNDEWLPELAKYIQGSRLSLRSLTHKVFSHLQENPKMQKIPYNTIMDKIKIIATRKQYLSSEKCHKGDKFQDTNERYMWRWELISLDFLPESMKASVKKARANRSKLQNHHKAILRLLTALHECDIVVSSAEPLSSVKKEEMVSKIAEEEEKVLKFERENEKLRLLEESKVQKLREKELKQAEKLQEKARAEDSKRAEKERKKQEAEEAKRKKDEEAQRQKDLVTEKQKARLLSFFKPAVSPTKPVVDTKTARPSLGDPSFIQPKGPVSNPTPQSTSRHMFSSSESEVFWKSICQGQSSEVADTRMFSTLSTKARQSRKRKTKRVSFTVFVRAISENDFENRVYDEERTVLIRNKYKFLGFHEDYRPPYHGTWSKPCSQIITGRTPFRQDSSNLDYSYDSEVEWEEGEDEEGDDCSESGHGDEEVDEEDGDELDYKDEWLAQEDDIKYEDNEDLDEEAKMLRKMKLNGNNATAINKAFSIAPSIGGIPVDDTCPHLVPELLQGITVVEAKQSLATYTVEVLIPALTMSLDAFLPQVDSDEKNNGGELLDEVNAEGLKLFVKFVRFCTLTSKDKVVEEFRSRHKDIISSKAQGMRILDLVASKKGSNARVVWEVKPEIIESLGLQNSSELIDENHHVVVAYSIGGESATNDPSSCVKSNYPSSLLVNSFPSITPLLQTESTLEKAATACVEGTYKNPPSSVSGASVNLLAKFLDNHTKCVKK